MSLPHTFVALEALVDSFINQSEHEKIKTFLAIKTIVDELRNELSEQGIDDAYVEEKLDDLVIHSKYAAGMDDNSHSEQQNISWSNAGVSSARNALSQLGVEVYLDDKA